MPCGFKTISVELDYHLRVAAVSCNDIKIVESIPESEDLWSVLRDRVIAHLLVLYLLPPIVVTDLSSLRSCVTLTHSALCLTHFIALWLPLLLGLRLT